MGRKKGFSNECVNRRLHYKVEQVVRVNGKSGEKNGKHCGEYKVAEEKVRSDQGEETREKWKDRKGYRATKEEGQRGTSAQRRSGCFKTPVQCSFCPIQFAFRLKYSILSTNRQ